MSTFIVWQQLAARQRYAQRIFICQTHTISRNIVEKKNGQKPSQLEVGSRTSFQTYAAPANQRNTERKSEIHMRTRYVKPVYIECVITLLISCATRVDESIETLSNSVSKNKPIDVSNIFNHEFTPLCFFGMRTPEE